jgi:hypothetical protein
MAERKICPLRNASEEGECWCVNEKCMWWDAHKKDCAMNLLVYELGHLVLGVACLETIIDESNKG